MERVRDPVGQERMDAGPGREDLERTHVARGGIAASRGRDVAPHLAHDAVEPPEAEHAEKPSYPPIVDLTGAKNGVET